MCLTEDRIRHIENNRTINIQHKKMNEEELEKEFFKYRKKYPKITLSLKEWRKQREKDL